MSEQLVSTKDYDRTKVTYSAPVVENGRKNVNVSYDEYKNLDVKFPAMKVAFDYKRDETAVEGSTTGEMNVKYSLKLAFDSIAHDTVDGKKQKAFHEMVSDIDEVLLEAAIAQPLEWLKLKRGSNRAVVEALQNKTIKRSLDKKTNDPDGKYPDGINVRIPYYSKTKRFGCTFLDANNKVISDQFAAVEKIKRGAKVMGILRYNVYFASGKFGYSLLLRAIRFISEGQSNRLPKNVCLVTESDDEDTPYTKRTSTDTQSKRQTNDNHVVSVTDETTNDDLDGDEDGVGSEEDRAPTPPPVQVEPPKLAKKVVRKVVAK
jgi:hypothetical protein